MWENPALPASLCGDKTESNPGGYRQDQLREPDRHRDPLAHRHALNDLGHDKQRAAREEKPFLRL